LMRPTPTGASDGANLGLSLTRVNRGKMDGAHMV
jgi:hypothetical protein